MYKQAVCDKCKHLHFRVKSSDKCKHSEGYYSCPFSDVCYFDWAEEKGICKNQFRFFEKKEG